MKTTVQILSACIGLSQLAVGEVHPSYEPKDWPRHVLRFSGEGSLKDIFDAGIRPYRFPSLETSTLGFKHVRIVVEMKGGERLPEIPAEWGDISMLREGLLSSIEITSQNLTTKEAEAAMSPFLERGKRTAIQLKQFLGAVAEDPRNYEGPYDSEPDGFAIVWNNPNGPNYIVFFKSSFDPRKPLSIALKISFFPIRTPLQQRSFYNIPIPPPPGYENVSMDAPRNFGPDSAVEIARSKGIPITGDRSPEEYEKQWHQANGGDRAPRSGNAGTEVPPEKAQGTPNWIWFTVLSAILLLVIVFWVQRRRHP